MARFSNRDRLLSKMAKLPPEVRSAIKQAIAQSADELTDAIKRLAPKKTGKLRDSVTQTWGGGKVAHASLSAGAGKGDPDLTVTITAGNSAVRYAHLVEFGTAPHVNGGKFAGSEHPGAKATPFFYPAYRAYKKRIKSRITRATTRAARSAAKG